MDGDEIQTKLYPFTHHFGKQREEETKCACAKKFSYPDRFTTRMIHAQFSRSPRSRDWRFHVIFTCFSSLPYRVLLKLGKGG